MVVRVIAHNSRRPWRMGRSWWLLSALAAAAVLSGVANIGIGLLHTQPGPHDETIAASHTPWKSDDASRPPLDSILQGKWNITRDPSWLLHFAIIGFPKCGTSTMMHHLSKHPQVSIFADERCDLAYNQQAVLIKDSYMYLGKRKMRGIKCPMLLESTQLGMRNMQKFFPKTHYIVGIRHPVLWFESFYNFRVQNEFPMPSPRELIGKCRKGSYNVCTFRSSFHLFLSNLQLTPMGAEELAYFDADLLKARDPFAASKSVRPRVFLYELSQLSREDEAGEADLRNALQSFLGLTTPIEPFIWFKPGRDHVDDEEKKKLIDSKKLNICDKEHWHLRKALQEQATNVSRWIRKHFLDAPGVFVSNRDHFEAVLKGWEENPCVKRTAALRT